MSLTQATLTVDLSAIAANYALLRSRHAKGQTAAVVKADAYGLGVKAVAPALQKAGCQHFFVATLEEGITLRSVIADAPIFIFQGPFKGEEKEYLAHNLSPVLNSPEQIARWVALPEKSPAALHVDTGMCRLGLSQTQLEKAHEDGALAKLDLQLLMSHLAVASEPDHPLNAEQLARFEAARKLLPGVACSLANSSGHFLDKSFHYDLGRPGCSLYGITPNDHLPNPMKHVATLDAPILQLREVDRDETIGYGATTRVTKGMRTATIAIGYADGIFRNLSHRFSGFIGGAEVPMLGRVSMDMLCFDVSYVPPAQIEKNPAITLIGKVQGVDRVAELCHTIGYEVFTRIGARVKRVYQD